MDTDPHERLADMDPGKLETLVEHADTLEELAEAREDNSISRREAVKLGTAVGLGGLLGGGGTAAMIDPASADASASDSDGDVGTSSDRVDVFGDGVDVLSLNTNKASITNESFVVGKRATGMTGLASGTYHNIIDTEVTDNLGEFNTSYQFVPNETGWYDVQAAVRLSTTDGDRLNFVVYDDTNASVVSNGGYRFQAGGTKPGSSFATTVKLSAGTKYAVKILNIDSSFDINGGAGFTWAKFKRSVVHP